MRREQGFLSGREIHEVEVVVPAADQTIQKRALPVSRDVGEAADPAVLRGHPHPTGLDVVNVRVDCGAVRAALD